MWYIASEKAGTMCISSWEKEMLEVEEKRPRKTTKKHKKMKTLAKKKKKNQIFINFVGIWDAI